MIVLPFYLLTSFLFFIKGLFTVLNVILFLLLLVMLAARFKKKKVYISLLVVTVVVFFLCSTAYLPQSLARQLEQQYLPLNPATLQNRPGKIYIHLLGSGVSLDKRLPPTGQLAPVAQCRLVEAIRIYKQLDSSVLVCSGNSWVGLETQASVAKKAAILLGVDSSRIITLNDPSTTAEEAVSLASTVGKKATIIIVTDALHMPRAYKLFTRQGFSPITAPANYRAPLAENDLACKLWPTIGNIGLMDMVLHEYLGNLKAAL